MLDVRPDLAVGTTPLVQKAKAIGIPSLYFTNMVSARPLFGAAGAGALAAIVAAQTKGHERFARMVSFFDKVGTGETAGYGWKDIPRTRPGRRTATAERGRRRPRRLRRWGPEMLVLDHDRAGGYWGRSMCSPRSAACGWSSTGRWAARTCR